MKYPTRDDIILINRFMASEFGGLFVYHCDNLCNPGSLDYLIDLVRWDEYYPTIFDKAALYCFTINSDHIFYDGNKRTGLETALLFLEINGRILETDVTPDQMIEFAWSVARGEFSRAAIAIWFEENTTAIGHDQEKENFYADLIVL